MKRSDVIKIVWGGAALAAGLVVLILSMVVICG